MQRTLRLLFILTIVSVFCFSCASTSTKLTWVWEDEAYNGGFLDDVMVIGVSENEIRRQMFEDHFVKEFQKRGVKAVSSAKIFPPEKKLSREEVLAEVEEQGLDAILITRLIRVKREEKFVAPSTTSYPNARYARFDIYSYTTGDYAKYGGSYEKRRDILLETNIYEAESQMIIWSGKSDSIKAKYVSDVIDSLCRTVMNDLRKKKLIK